MCPLYCPNNACFAEKAFHIPSEAVLRAYGDKRLHCARKAAAVNSHSSPARKDIFGHIKTDDQTLLSQLWFVSDPKEAVDNLRRQKALEDGKEQ